MSGKKTVAAQQDAAEAQPVVSPPEAQQVAVRQAADVDPRTGATVHIGVPERSDQEEVQDLLVWLQECADAESQDAVSRIAENLRHASTATSLADLLREKETVSSRDYADQPFMATGWAAHEGEFEGDGMPFFVSINAVDPRTGREFIVNGGGEKVLPYWHWVVSNMEFPFLMCFTAKQTRKGRTVMSFAILEDQAHQQ